MKTFSWPFLMAAICFTTLLPSELRAQDPEGATIRGTVIDAVTGQPVEGASVEMEDLSLVVVSGSDGTFAMAGVPLGPHQLTIQCDGYETRSGRLMVDRSGEKAFPLNPLGGARATDMSRVQGVVRDDGGDVLEGATVSLRPVGQVRMTNGEGHFLFENVPPGELQLTVEFLGFATRQEVLTILRRKIVSLDLELTVEAIELDPIEISVEARDFDLEISGFYGRRDATSGQFITRERIESRDPLYTSDLFRSLPGVRVIGGLGMGTQQAIVLSGSRAMSFTSEHGRCYPAVWIDGQMVHQGSGGPLELGPAFLDQLIQPDQIAGIEVYSSPASVPLQFNVHSSCGVVVFWTRLGR